MAHTLVERGFDPVLLVGAILLIALVRLHRLVALRPQIFDIVGAAQLSREIR